MNLAVRGIDADIRWNNEGSFHRDELMPRIDIEIVKRSDHAKGFVILPKRWVVERTFAWLGRCRRLAKDFEKLTRMATAFIHLASIRLMLRRLCNTARPVDGEF
jgi:transposase